MPEGSKPSTAIFSFTSGLARIAAISRCSRLTISFGVPAGASTPCMVSASCPLMPSSSSVGTSGSAAARLSDVTASARSLPSLISSVAGGIAWNESGVWPATTAWIAGVPPENGTTSRSLNPSDCRNSSIDSDGVVPAPGEATEYFVGLALMSATSSFTSRAATEGCAINAWVAAAALVIGMKSLSGS